MCPYSAWDGRGRGVPCGHPGRRRGARGGVGRSGATARRRRPQAPSDPRHRSPNDARRRSLVGSASLDRATFARAMAVAETARLHGRSAAEAVPTSRSPQKSTSSPQKRVAGAPGTSASARAAWASPDRSALPSFAEVRYAAEQRAGALKGHAGESGAVPTGSGLSDSPVGSDSAGGGGSDDVGGGGNGELGRGDRLRWRMLPPRAPASRGHAAAHKCGRPASRPSLPGQAAGEEHALRLNRTRVTAGHAPSRAVRTPTPFLHSNRQPRCCRPGVRLRYTPPLLLRTAVCQAGAGPRAAKLNKRACSLTHAPDRAHPLSEYGLCLLLEWLGGVGS